ncbi:MAG: YhbY family RNA-binding protein [Nanoarchaeota archaeon]|nr:YhbY family RNA-binding protein [Nanoarchaeota archaeon]
MKEVMQLQMGKKGLTDNFVNQLKLIFEKEHLIKVSLLKSSTRDKAEAKKIADELVAKLGVHYSHTMIGYKITIRKWRKAQQAIKQ